MNYLKYFRSFFRPIKESKNPSDLWNMIPQSIKEINELFKQNGKKLYLVGGSVRDFLTGDTPKDFDLATDALPDEVLKILGDSYKTNLQGKAFGVVVVYPKDQPEGVEIATFRQDTSKGRNPEVKLGVTIEDDVKRRDITYNSLFFDLDKKEIVDLIGGVKDLESGITRMVGDAAERFDEDSLRILRAFRFASRYGHPLDSETIKAIEERRKIHPKSRLMNVSPVSNVLEPVSQERIWEEFKKAFKQAKDFNHYINFIDEFDMWNEMFPNCKINVERIQSKDLIVVLANLMINENPKSLERKMINDWRIEGDTAKKVTFLVNLLQLDINNAPTLYKQKVSCAIDSETIKEWISVRGLFSQKYMAFLKYEPRVSGDELMKLGFKGKALGEEINRIQIEQFKKLLK